MVKNLGLKFILTPVVLIMDLLTPYDLIISKKTYIFLKT